MKSEADRIIEEEGFSAVPYPDPIHGWDKPTFGHGLTYIDRDESERLVRHRYEDLRDWVVDALRERGVIDPLGGELQGILAHMAYQLGRNGVLRFEKMWAALQDCDFRAAADEMLDSKWHEQTPERCERLADRMRALADE